MDTVDANLWSIVAFWHPFLVAAALHKHLHSAHTHRLSQRTAEQAGFAANALCATWASVTTRVHSRNYTPPFTLAPLCFLSQCMYKQLLLCSTYSTCVKHVVVSLSLSGWGCLQFLALLPQVWMSS